jgi:hypothetical protein
MAEHPRLREAADRARARKAWTPDQDPRYHRRDASALRLHGAGDGSVMAYCDSCAQALSRLPRGRALTLAVLEERWAAHLREVDGR